MSFTNIIKMPLVSTVLVLPFVYTLTYALASLDTPMQPLIDGSKFAFIRVPYLNTVKLHKEVAAQNDVSLQWTNGIVPYYFDPQSYDDGILTNILRAIDIIEKRSCIQFMKLESKLCGNTTWIHITNPTKERECVHEPRIKESGEIVLVLGYNCLTLKEILHSILHGIGMKDEVTHPHRDRYIRVLWDNIQPEYHHLYRKQIIKPSTVLVEYDPLSIMQFHDRAFSRNGRATIASLEPGLLISPSETLSQLDQMRLKVNFGHECNKRSVSNLLQSCKLSFNQGIENVNGHTPDNKNGKDRNVEYSEYSAGGDDDKQNEDNLESKMKNEKIIIEKDSTENANKNGDEPSGETEVEFIQKEETNINNEDSAESANEKNSTEGNENIVLPKKNTNVSIGKYDTKNVHVGNTNSDKKVKLSNKIKTAVFHGGKDSNSDEFVDRSNDIKNEITAD